MASRPTSPLSRQSRVRTATALAAWCAPFRSGDDPPRLDEEDWMALADLADRHKVTALLAERLETSPDRARVPGAVATRLEESRMSAASLYRARTLVIAQLLDSLERAGVRPMLLKGQAIAERVYASPCTRLGRDVDILVRPGEMAAANAVLGSLDYAPVTPERYRHGHFHQPWHSQRRAASGPIEVHWDVVEPGDPVRFDLPSWWEGASPHRFPFGVALLPPPEAEIGYVAFHALQHGSTTLRDLSDVALLAARLAEKDQRERVEAHARTAGCAGFLDAAAWLIGSIWGEGALHGPLERRARPGRLARVLYDPSDLLANGPEERWTRMELARWSCLPRERAGLAEPFRRAIARHRTLASAGAGRRRIFREARVAFVLAASLARVAARA